MVNPSLLGVFVLEKACREFRIHKHFIKWRACLSKACKLNKSSNPRDLGKLISCLSILENDTSLLYENLSTKVSPLLLKSLLLSIAEDSKKHSALLKGVAGSINKTPEKARNCRKNMGDVWRLVGNLRGEINSKKSYSEEELSQLSQKLASLESILGEEYYMFVQMKTLKMMAKEINQIYGIDVGSIKSIFTHIITDEEHHREVLGTIRSIIDRQPKVDRNPFVKYTNPDNWISPSPPTS
jgi:rubrerythrin